MAHFGVVAVHWGLIFPKVLYTYYTVLKSGCYGLSNGIKSIQIKRLMPICSDSKFEKSFFSYIFLNKDISFNIP